MSTLKSSNDHLTLNADATWTPACIAAYDAMIAAQEAERI